tara:strand:+ start:4386 stop:5789 length:1404 start_codon:yes stop_codon:yes gene_type:complete
MSAFEKAWDLLKIETPFFPDDDEGNAYRAQWELEHGGKKVNPRNKMWEKQQDRSNEPMGEGEDRNSERRFRGQETYHGGGSRVQTRGKISAADRASRAAQQKLRMHRAKIDDERNARVVAARQDEHQVEQGHHPGSMMNDEDIADPGYRPPRKQRDMYNPRDESAKEYDYDADKRRYVEAQDMESIDDKSKTLQNKVKDSMEMGRPKGTIGSMVIKPGTEYGLHPNTEKWIGEVNDTHTDEETGRSKKIVGFGKTGEHWVDDTIDPKHPMQQAVDAGHLDDMEHSLSVQDHFGNPIVQQGGDVAMTPEAKERLDAFMVEMNTAAQPARRQWTSAEQKPDEGEDNTHDSRGTFYGLPWNEDTGFTTGEPMDIAYQLLKDSDWEKIPPCPNCKGTGEDPNEEGQPEIGIEPGECEPCDGTGKDLFGSVAIDEEGRPIESFDENNPNWQDSIETGEPMDIAYQLLKNQMI